MKRTVALTWATALSFFILLSSGDASAGRSKQVAREAFRWTGKLAPAQTLYLRDMNGDLEVQAAAGDQIEVVVTERKKANEKKSIEMKVQPVKDGIMICALYPGGGGKCGADGSYKSDGDGDVDLVADYVVKLPAGVRVDVATVNGDVSVRGATDRAKVVTVNGDVVVETTGGPVIADTVNGDVSVRAGSNRVKAESVNGDVEISVPAAIDAELSAKTVKGEIGNDFGLPTASGVAGSELHGKVGKGTHRLAAQTVNGDVRLKKQ
jgi:hypothetical protein